MTRILVVGLIMALSSHVANAGDCEHDQRASATDQVVKSVSKREGAQRWDISIDEFSNTAGNACSVDSVTTDSPPPESCQAGARLTATGRLFVDYSSGLYDVSEITCKRP